jgi:RimJ/RimL family protein N-acetyltransferase
VPNSSAKQKDFYEECEKRDDIYALEIHVADDDRYIGIIGFDSVDMRHRMGEFGIAIGPPEERGKGYGRDATITCLRWGFDTLGLHAAWLGAIDDNERALALYRDVGFRDAGRLRSHLFVDGAFHDMVVMDFLADEFRQRYGIQD